MADDDKRLRDALGHRIMMRRTELKLSQTEVAERLGLSNPETISRYERGQRDPRFTTLMRLATALELPIGDLLAPADSDAIRPWTLPNSKLKERRSKRGIPSGVGEEPTDRVIALMTRLAETCPEHLATAVTTLEALVGALIDQASEAE